MLNVLIKALYRMNDTKVLTFHPTVHQGLESIPVRVCMCIIILGLGFTRIKLNPTLLTQITLFTYQHWKQDFPLAILPQRITLSSACFKGLLVIPNLFHFPFSILSFFSFFFLFHFFHFLFFLFFSKVIVSKTSGRVNHGKLRP